MDRWMDGQIDGWMVGWIGRWMDEQIDRWMDICRQIGVYKQIDGWI